MSKEESKDKRKGSSVALRRKKSKAAESIKVAPTAKPQGNAAAMMRRGRSPNSPNKKKKTKKRKKRKSKKGKTRRKSRKSKKGTKKRQTK